MKAHGVTFIDLGKGHGGLSSNPGHVWVSLRVSGKT